MAERKECIPEIEKEREELIKLYQTQFPNIVEPVKQSIKSFEASIPAVTFSIRTEIRN